MKKLLCLLLAALMVCGMLAGCASEPKPAETTQPAADTPATEKPAEEPAEEPAETSTTEPAADKTTAIAATTEGSIMSDSTDPHDMWNKGAPYHFAEAVENYPANTEYPLVDEPYTFSVWMGWTNYNSCNGQLETPNDSPAMKAALEKTGIDLEWTLANDAATQFPLLLASEDYTDMYINAGSAQLAVYADDEIILDITDVIPANAPNYQALRMDDADYARRSKTDDGRLLAMFGVHTLGGLTWLAGMTRQDWLGDRDPVTYDDFHEVLVDYRDTYQCPSPLSIAANGQETFYMAGYNVGTSWIVVDGEVRHSVTEPGYKQYLEMMHQWYEEKLIDQEFYGRANFAFDFEYLTHGATGMYTSAYQYMGITETFAEDPATYRIVGVRCPVQNEGDQRLIELSANRSRYMDDAYVAFFNTCSNVDLAVQFCDFWFCPDGGMLKAYGVEGEGFYFDEDGVPLLSDMILYPEDSSLSSNQVRYLVTADYFPGLLDWTRDQKAGMSELALEAPMKWDSNWNDTISFPDVTRTLEEGEEYSHLMTDIETRINETIARFITGEKPLTEWEAFVDELRGMGLDTARDIQQDAYDRFIAR